MLRRILIILLGALALVLVGLATLPFWFGSLLGTFAPRYGVTFTEYTRLGYDRFALRGVEYRADGIRATAERIEGPSPIPWLWQRVAGSGAHVDVGRWAVTVGEKHDPARPKPDRTTPSGWVPLRAQIREAVATLEPWLAQATIGPGTVTLPAQAISFAGADWRNGTLRIDDVAFKGRVIDATLVVPRGREELRLDARTATAEARVSMTSRAADVSGEIAWWGEPATFRATFPATGWTPVRAEAAASDWELPAEKLRLGEHYATVHGDARLRWNEERFTLDVTARSTAPAGREAAPPLEVELHANGDLEAITVDELQASMPGAHARLTAPVTIARSGQVRGGPGRFETRIQLSELPWLDGNGEVSGQIEVASPAAGVATPPATFHFQARDVSTEGVALSSADVQGRLEWPRVQVAEATVVGTHRERLRLSGGWDFKRKAANEVKISGELRQETFARWLPEAVEFDLIRVEASADGTIAELRHQGTLTAAAVTAGPLKPMQARVEWNGRGLAAEPLSATVTAGKSRVSLTAAIDRESARLTALEFIPGGGSPVRLTGPAIVRWSPNLEVEGLSLRGDGSAVDTTVRWAESGRVALALRGIPSDWLADFVTLPGPPWRIASFAMNGRWDRGPLEFEAVAHGSAAVRDERNLAAHMHWRGGSEGLQLVAFRALENGAAVATASGRAPAVIVPRGTPMLRLTPGGRVALNASTIAETPFWEHLSELIGVTLHAPKISANIAGTWREPEGELRATVGRVAFPARDGKRLPALEQIELTVTGNRRGISIEQLALKVENQAVRASGRLPFPEDEWAGLRKDPIGYVRRGADVRLDIPGADLAAFSELLPAIILPQGTVQAHVTVAGGALGGSLQLRDAATRPSGAVAALHEIAADVVLEGEVVRITTASARLGGEPLRISGTITLPPLERVGGGAPAALPKFDLTAKARNIPLVRRIGTLVRADLDLALKSPADAAPIVSGSVRLRDSLFLQDVRGLIPSGTRSKSERPPYFAVEVQPFADWRLDVRVAGDEFMRLRTTVFNGTASADFRLAGTLGEPTLLGEATIDRGNIRLPFASFEVQEGRVALTPAQPHEPEIFLAATTRRFEYDLRMEVTGDASSPVVTFESTPPLEHGQILLMVTAGVVPNEDVTVTQRQRVTRLGTYLGQSLLSGIGGGDTNRLTITGGEEISEQGRETYDIEYKLDDRWSVTAEYDEYDTHSLGVKWQALARGGKPAGADNEPAAGDDPAPAEPAGAGAPTGREEPGHAGDDRDRKPAKLDVSGLGWFSNLEMEASLKRLLAGGYGPVLNSHSIEDAVFLLLSAVRADGYLRPTVRVHVVGQDGTRREFTVDAELTKPVPRNLAAREVQFHVERGTHYFVEDLEIAGLDVIDPDVARGYFVADPGLFNRQSALTFTPDRIKRGVAGLEAALRERGYAEASVTAGEPRIDHDTGKVRIAVSVDEGPQWRIASVTVAGEVDEVGAPEGLSAYAGQPWSESTQQDIAAAVRRNHLHAGYADARVRVSHTAQPTGDGAKAVEVVARVTPGPRVTVGQIRFEGNTKTAESVLQRRVPFSPGDPLDPVAVQQARHRISRLGVFEEVDVEVEPADGAVRDVVFALEPGRRMELNLLAGYNTYEKLRAGVEVLRYNVWGRAHRTRGLLVQSMKSTRGEYSYTVPELFGEDVHGTARLFGLQREEVAFLRQEYGARFTVDTPLRFLGADLTAGYTFEVLRNRENELESREFDRRQVEVASVEAGLTRDRRDNPLLPRDGYRWFGRIEAASGMFGGRAEYQRMEMGGTYHRPVGTGRWLHFGLGHGIITTLGRGDEQLPVNKRFFPGGDGSNRGYELGEAAPRSADGRFVGAKSYLAASIEFEQALLAKWSAVAFVDALGSASRLSEYPFEDVLVAVGLGVRYHTLIGPVRAEYGYNLNRRERDPRGTFLLSIGFPF